MDEASDSRNMTSAVPAHLPLDHFRDAEPARGRMETHSAEYASIACPYLERRARPLAVPPRAEPHRGAPAVERLGLGMDDHILHVWLTFADVVLKPAR
jgi:hypothetical protein